MTTREALLSTDESLHVMMGRAFDEASKAAAQYGDFASMHEAYGVIAEEIDELFDAVKMKQSPERCDAIYHEAVQCAATCLRIAEQARRVTR